MYIIFSPPNMFVMNTRYVVTNRRVDHEIIFSSPNDHLDPALLSREQINNDGKEEATMHVRYARITGNNDIVDFEDDPNDIVKLYPHLENDDADFGSTNYSLKFGSLAMFNDLYNDMCSAEGGDLLIFVHGYRNDLTKAIKNLGTLEKRYIRKGSPIKHLLLFTWPSQNRTIKYKNDIQDSIESGKALGRTLLKLQRFFQTFFQDGLNPVCGRKIHIMAQSSGARVLEYAMKYVKDWRHELMLESIFTESIIMAGDVDSHALELDQDLSYLCNLSSRVHVYNHKKDKALLISNTFKNVFPRLGHKGVRNFANLPTNVVMIDATDVKEETTFFENLANHWYYVTSESVVNDVIHTLNGVAAIDIVKESDSKREAWPDRPNLFFIKGGDV